MLWFGLVPDQFTDAERLALGHALERIYTWARREGAPGVLPPTTLTTLDRLSRTGAMRITDLAEAEQVSQPGMTTLVHRMERSGLVARTTLDSDRRVTLVGITDAGIAAVARHRAARATQMGERLAVLSPTDRSLLLQALPAIEQLTADRPAAVATDAQSTERTEVSPRA